MSHPSAGKTRVDVLIVTAVIDEWNAVLAVDAGAKPDSAWETRVASTKLEIAFREFATAKGVLTVAVTQALDMGGVEAVMAAAPLLAEYDVRCLAMCGVCAGRRGSVELGDVIIADRIWDYDTGKIEVETRDGQRVEHAQADMKMHLIQPPGWKQAAERFQIDRAAAWVAHRPRSHEAQGDWILERVHRDHDPTTDPDRATCCADFDRALERLWAKELLVRGTLTLTDSGREHIETLLLRNLGNLPEQKPFQTRVGPIASGSKVVEDPDIFARLALSVRKVLGVEMEAAAIGALARDRQLPCSIVMKAVMDHADADKSDNFKSFAARASAECLIAFLRQHLLPRNAADLGPEKARPGAAPRHLHETLLLTKVRSFWIDNVLDRSLKNELWLELPKDERPAAVDRGFELAVEQVDEQDVPFPEGFPVASYFEHRQRALLILGEPGAGKTTTLLELTRGLLDRAAEDATAPLPVVLNLSSWRGSKMPIAAWVAEQLSKEYLINRAVGKAWIEQDRLALMLDGLDEIAPAIRGDCVDALNRFREEHGVAALAIACRREEYEALPARLRLEGAVVLRALDDARIDRYLAAGGERLAALARALYADAELREMARTPLMLSIMGLTYGDGIGGDRDAPVESWESGAGPASREDRRLVLLDRYVERMFRRREITAKYARDRVLKALIWMAGSLRARNTTAFLLEEIQPDALRDRWWRLGYFALTRIGGGAVVGAALFAAFFSVLNAALAGFFPTRTSGAALGLAMGLPLALFDFRAASKLRDSDVSWRASAKQTALLMLVGGGTMSLRVALFLEEISLFTALAALIMSFLVAVPLAAILVPRRRSLAAGRDIRTVEGINVLWRRVAALGTLLTLIPGLALGFFPWTRSAATVWDTSSLKPVATFSGEIRAAHLSPDGNHLLLSRADEVVSVNVTTRVTTVIEPAALLAIDSNWQHAVGRAAGAVKFEGPISPRFWDIQVWNVDGAGEQWTPGAVLHLEGQYWEGSAQFSPSGEWVLTTTSAGKYVHEASSGRRTVTLALKGAAKVASDGAHVVVAGAGFTEDRNLSDYLKANWLNVYRSRDGALVLHIPEEGQSAPAQIFGDVHPGGAWLATLSDGCVGRVDLTDAHRSVALAGPCVPGQAQLLFSPSGHRLLVYGKNGARLFDERGALVESISRAGTRRLSLLRTAVFTRDGATIVVTEDGGRVLFFRADDGTFRGEIAQRVQSDASDVGLDSSRDGGRVLTWASHTSFRSLGVAGAVLGLVLALSLSLRRGAMGLKTRPNQGIHVTARTAILAAFVPAAAILALLFAFHGMEYWGLSALTALVVGLVLGGFDLIAHYTLRGLLALRGDLPLRSARLLDQATDQIFLRKVGGGYIFIHRIVLDYFACNAESRLVRGKKGAPVPPRTGAP